MGLWHIWGFHRELPAARQVGREMHRQAQDTRRRRLALPVPEVRSGTSQHQEERQAPGGQGACSLPVVGSS